jgi:hypothetical protein
MLEVKVIVDLGERTVALLTGATHAPKVEELKPLRVLPDAKPLEEGHGNERPKEEPVIVKAEVPKEEPAKRTRRTKEQIAAEEAQTANGWDEMDDDAKLEAIKTEMAKHVKKGKSADIRLLLSEFDASRTSEFAPEDYDAFFDAITRYGKGESAKEIIREGLN